MRPVNYDTWEHFVSIAPKDQIVNGAKPTEEQKELGMKKTDAANKKREARVAAMFDADKGEGHCGQIRLRPGDLRASV